MAPLWGVVVVVVKNKEHLQEATGTLAITRIIRGTIQPDTSMVSGAIQTGILMVTGGIQTGALIMNRVDTLVKIVIIQHGPSKETTIQVTDT